MSDFNEVKEEEVIEFINGNKKGEVIVKLIVEKGYDLPKAEAFWKAYGVGATATGFIALFDKALVKKDFTDSEVKTFVVAYGTNNTLRHLSSYVTRAKLSRDTRASVFAEIEAKVKANEEARKEEAAKANESKAKTVKKPVVKK